MTWLFVFLDAGVHWWWQF